MILYIFFKKQFRCFILQAQCFPDSFKSFTFPIIPKFPTDDWLMEYDISIPPTGCASLLAAEPRALPCLPDCLQLPHSCLASIILIAALTFPSLST